MSPRSKNVAAGLATTLFVIAAAQVGPAPAVAVDVLAINAGPIKVVPPCHDFSTDIRHAYESLPGSVKTW